MKLKKVIAVAGVCSHGDRNDRRMQEIIVVIHRLTAAQTVKQKLLLTGMHQMTSV